MKSFAESGFAKFHSKWIKKRPDLGVIYVKVLFLTEN